MNLVVVAHSYIHPQWQGKLASLSSEFSHVTVIQPSTHIANGIKYHSSSSSCINCSNLTFAFLPSINVRSPTWYIYLNPFRFIFLIFKLKPDCILLEEDPYSLVGVLTLFSLFLCLFLRKDTKLCLFSWDNLNRSNPNLLAGWAKKISIFVARRFASGYIAGNSESARIAQKVKNFKCPVVVLPYVGIDAYSDLPRRYPDKDNLVIGFVGRLVPQKGVLLLAESARILNTHKTITLLYLGSGPLLNELKDFTRYHNLSAVFPGSVPFDQVSSCLDNIDILVLPSISTPVWREQFGLVLAQAMAQGIPCIGSSSGAIPEVINDPRLIFKEGSIHSLADRISELASIPSLYESASCRAWDRARQCFSSHAVGRNYSTFLRSICCNKRTCVFQDSPYSFLELHDC